MNWIVLRVRVLKLSRCKKFGSLIVISIPRCLSRSTEITIASDRTGAYVVTVGILSGRPKLLLGRVATGVGNAELCENEIDWSVAEYVARLERDNAHERNKTRGARRFSRVRNDIGDIDRAWGPAAKTPKLTISWKRKRAAGDGMSSIYYVGDA